VAGIEPIAAAFKTIRVRPLLDPRLRQGGGDYESIMGRISTEWKRTEDGGMSLDVTIPANTTAYIHLPAGKGHQILESDKDISRQHHIRMAHRSTSEAIIQVGSGAYRFVTLD
jgi:alpha-L-rhamnosidase